MINWINAVEFMSYEFYTLYFIFYILYFIFYILYSIFYILYFIFYILYSIFYILYSIFYILYVRQVGWIPQFIWYSLYVCLEKQIIYICIYIYIVYVIYDCFWHIYIYIYSSALPLPTKYTIQRNGKGKGKAVPLQVWCGPESSRKLRFPDFMTAAQDGGEVVSPTHRPPLPPGMFLVLIFTRGWVDPSAIVR
jgi:hypothetical protein